MHTRVLKSNQACKITTKHWVSWKMFSDTFVTQKTVYTVIDCLRSVTCITTPLKCIAQSG